MPLHYDIYYYYTETISAAVCSGRVIWMEFTMPIFLPSNLMKQMSEVLNTSNGAQSNRIHSRQVKVFHSQPIHMVSQLPAVNSIALVDAWDGDVEVIFSSMRLLMFCICILSVWN
ncbi:uncharacterized protein LOC105261939 [Musca domestica]|uniref:Uncharacterized protein LOC105261939 n=1 Tax=Musca domestica TaxID=7370 RepID=A0A1I8NIS0_MUSDO|nr:uncharacterized protein LOC105261939 [Musca domestica]